MSGKVFMSALMNVGQEKDFYEVRDMLDSDVSILKRTLIDSIRNPMLRKAASDWIPAFQMIQKARIYAESKGIDASDVLRPLYIEFEELLHGEIERNAIPLLDKLLDADSFCLKDDEEYIAFSHFLMTQYFRTSRIKKNLQRGIGDIVPGYVDRTIGVIRHICATTSAFNLVGNRQNYRPYLVNNETSTPFITGDQPVINTIAVEVDFGEVINDCEFYYPISPNKAIFVTKSDSYASGVIKDNEQAKRLNRLITQSAERQIYASSKSEFGECAALVGGHLA